MSALNQFRQGVKSATAVAALLFVAPALAATEPAKQAHAWASVLELHGLGSLAGFRLVSAIQNASAGEDASDDDGGCGAEADELDLEAEVDNAHAVLAVDEAIADRSAAGPEHDAHAFFVNDGESRYLAIVPPAGIDGTATLTLRPRAGSSEVVRLGRVQAGQALLITRPEGSFAQDRTIEAIELEWRSAHAVSWSTVPQLSASRAAAASIVARASH